MLKADLHIHTLYSSDSDLSPEQILEKAAKIGLDVVGIVDHGSQKGGLVAKRIEKKYKVFVLVGQEIRTAQGEIIVFGLNRTLPSREDIATTCQTAKGAGGLIILPHPFDPFRHSVRRAAGIAHFVDAVEVFNPHCLFNTFNQKAAAFAKRHNLPGIAGSDAHRLDEIGQGLTFIDARPDQKSIFSAIRAGKMTIKPARVTIGRLTALIRA